MGEQRVYRLGSAAEVIVVFPLYDFDGERLEVCTGRLNRECVYATNRYLRATAVLVVGDAPACNHTATGTSGIWIA